MTAELHHHLHSLRLIKVLLVLILAILSRLLNTKTNLVSDNEYGVLCLKVGLIFLP